MSRIKLNKTLNGYAIVDAESKQPYTPIYFVAYGKEDEAKATEIFNAVINNLDLAQYEGYRYKVLF